jgi:hypothetical protein
VSVTRPVIVAIGSGGVVAAVTAVVAVAAMSASGIMAGARG